jgi:hypothetical protein
MPASVSVRAETVVKLTGSRWASAGSFWAVTMTVGRTIGPTGCWLVDEGWGA